MARKGISWLEAGYDTPPPPPIPANLPLTTRLEMVVGRMNTLRAWYWRTRGLHNGFWLTKQDGMPVGNIEFRAWVVDYLGVYDVEGMGMELLEKEKFRQLSPQVQRDRPPQKI